MKGGAHNPFGTSVDDSANGRWSVTLKESAR